MQTQINSFIKQKSVVKPVKIFGYATRGIPGLEIVGAGKCAKNVKEKIIYITKMRSLPIPLKRYIICLEQNDLDEFLGKSEIMQLEFPILLMFWYLAGLIPISKLDDCLCAGRLEVAGQIIEEDLNLNILTGLNQNFKIENIKFISNKVDEKADNLLILPPHALLKEIPFLQFI